MLAKELRGKTQAELVAMLREHRQRLNSLRAEVAEGKAKNVRELRRLKREVARCLTVLRQTEVTVAPVPPPPATVR